MQLCMHIFAIITFIIQNQNNDNFPVEKDIIYDWIFFTGNNLFALYLFITRRKVIKSFPPCALASKPVK